MYSNVVSKWGGVMVNIIEACYKERQKKVDYLNVNEFWFDFVGVLALQEAQLKEKQAAILEFDFWQKVLKESPEHSETARGRLEDLIERI